jgi:hypothetical protein
VATSEVGIRITAVDDTKTAFGSINSGLAGLGNAAASVSGSLASLGIGLSAGAFVAFAKNVINGIDALNDLKDATGASIENISALEDVARRTGTSLDTVGTSLVKLNQALGNAKPGSDTEKAINAIGLSVKDLKQLDPAEAFRQIAVELNKFADDGNKARLTQELFGKSLKEIAPLLKDVAEQGALVGKVTTEQADAAEAFNKELFAMQANISDVSRLLVSDFVIGINAAAKAWREYGAVAGIQTFLTGDDQFKNNKQLVDQTDQLLSLEREIQTLKQSGTALDAALLRRKQEDLKVLKEQLTTTQAYRKVLSEGTVGGAPAAGKPSLKPPPEVDKAAQAAALAQQKQFLAERLKLSRQAVIDEGQALMDANDAFQKALDKSYQAYFKEQTDAIAESAKNLDAVQKSNAALALENETIGLTSEALNELILSRQDAAIAALQMTIAGQEVDRQMGFENGTLKNNIVLLKELQKQRGLTSENQSKTRAAESVKKAADEAKRYSDQLENLITDGIYRGFENGKSIAENFADVLENTFKTLVLRPVIQATVQGVLGTDGGSGGIAGGVGGFVGGLQKAGKAFESAQLCAH